MRQTTTWLVMLIVASVGPVRAQDVVDHVHSSATSEAAVPIEPAAVADHAASWQIGPWTGRFHGFATVGASGASGPRGQRAGYGTNMVMASLSRRAWGGIVTAKFAGSLEPAMGPRGYALLLQTGETGDGILPLVDRQHPHDAVDEMSIPYRREHASGVTSFLSGGVVGAPAFGPAVFMHRSSGASNPEAPLSHHHLDGMHVTHGVVSGGVRRGPLTLEGFVFNGIEPDEDRWDLDLQGFDSYSVRVRIDPHPTLMLQASFARVPQPERLHPQIGVVKVSVSASAHRSAFGGSWDATVAMGRNKSERAIISLIDAERIFSPPVLAHYVSISDIETLPREQVFLVFPTRLRSSWLIESSYRRGRATAFGRLEQVDKDELFDTTDPRHSQVFRITKITVGLLERIWMRRLMSFSLGALGSAHVLPTGLDAAYGMRPVGWRAFARLDIGHVP